MPAGTLRRLLLSLLFIDLRIVCQMACKVLLYALRIRTAFAQCVFLRNLQEVHHPYCYGLPEYTAQHSMLFSCCLMCCSFHDFCPSSLSLSSCLPCVLLRNHFSSTIKYSHLFILFSHVLIGICRPTQSSCTAIVPLTSLPLGLLQSL